VFVVAYIFVGVGVKFVDGAFVGFAAETPSLSRHS